MGISGNDVQKQLRQMIAFIEQEASEKVEEIDTRTEEEFNVEKARLVRQQRTNIIDCYHKKEKQVEIERKIQRSNMHNQGRLKCLRARDDHFRSVFDEARANLSRISQDESRYSSILKGLILQALLKLLEKDVTVKCREKDKELVSRVLPECLEEAYKIWGNTTKVTIEDEHLANDCAGGVEMTAKGGKIKVCSTLESRLELIAGQVIPQVRATLFGPNPSRKFFD